MGVAPLILEVIAVMEAAVVVADDEVEVELDVEFVVVVVAVDAESCAVVLPPSLLLVVCVVGRFDWDIETSETEVDGVVGPSRLCK